MKPVVVAAASGMVVVLAGAVGYASARPVPAARVPVGPVIDIEATAGKASVHSLSIPVDTLTRVIRGTCASCHSNERKAGDITLQGFDVAQAAKNPELTEKIIVKLRAGMMPPPGRRRPGGDTLPTLAATLERLIDQAAATNPDPGGRTFQRLNRAEYGRSIRALLALDVAAGSWLPLDTKSANFDNIADVQMPSATTLDAYLDAASEIARLAVGDAKSRATSATYKIPRIASQVDHVEGTPQGTRGGVAVTHTFPADGEYVFGVMLHAIPTGQLFGSAAPFDEKVEISVNGERVAVLDIDRSMSQADPNGMLIKTPAVRVRGGPRRISAAFLRTFDGPVNDLVAPIGHSLADTQIGAQSGVTTLPHIQDFVVMGPYNPTGVSETPSRRKIFSCRPTSRDEERPCAQKIVSELGAGAYRRPLAANDLKALMAFFDQGAKEGGFELGIRTAIEAILSSPHFIFRVEELPGAAKPGERYAIGANDLASRLSFFLWATPPDEKLLAAARSGQLATAAGLEAQARRMLADPRAEALATRFASQWLRLQDIEKVHPDALQYPNFNSQLGDDMKRETELFFYGLVRENRSILELFTANYTYLNESLARHYGIDGVTGADFRRVRYPDNRRSGLLGHASILTLTSHANRTSPVLRGKWVMEVLLGSPPPPPPPDIPDLEKTSEAKEGRMLTTRERMEMHRENPSCRSCHQFMDPIGLALDNFDVTGQWRIRENGAGLDTRGQFYDGTDIATPAELQQVLMKRPVPMVRTFTLNLMAYALGRRAGYYDMPTVRRIVADAEAWGYKIADFVVGIVKSDAFRMKKVPAAQAAAGDE